MKESDIKSIAPHECPYCKKVFVVEFVASAPSLEGVYTLEDLQEAKKQAVQQINMLFNVDGHRKQELIDWINQEDTLFSPKDIPDIIDGLKE